jgi:citrate synthase
MLLDLIGNISYSEMAYLLLAGSLPTSEQTQMLDAIFVALAEHGISPSSIIVRYLASCGTPLQAAIAGAATSIGDYHGGAGEALARVLERLVSCSAADEDAMRIKATELVASYRTEGRRFEGFGHPQHTSGDPRATRLLQLAHEYGVAGAHVRALDLVGEEIAIAIGRTLAVNINGALAAIAMDLGFSWQTVRGLVIAPRVAGLTAHYVEEIEQGGRWRHVSADKVAYTGRQPK